MKQKKEQSDTSNEPIIKSIGILKQPKGWSVVKLTTQGAQVISQEMSEANTKAIAMANLKIAVVRELLST